MPSNYSTSSSTSSQSQTSPQQPNPAPPRGIQHLNHENFRLPSATRRCRSRRQIRRCPPEPSGDWTVPLLPSPPAPPPPARLLVRSEEHTSELQSRQYLVCRLLLENKR